MKRSREDTPLAPLRMQATSFYGAKLASAPSAVTCALPPLHDPCAAGAVVLSCAGDARFAFASPSPRPGAAHTLPPPWPPVVVDPHVGVRLRAHQREGVAFAFAALSGGSSAGAHTGCLLAHGVGLGKTLTALATAHTLLKQSPLPGPTAGGHRGLARRAVVACPAGLVDTWAAEARRWFGASLLGVRVIRPGGDAASAATDWARPSNGAHPLVVVSYETLRSVAHLLAAGRPGLLVCDEAQRLGGAPKGTLDALKALGASRRLLLSATPVQNNIGELWEMLDFACPGSLGSRAAFSSRFETPMAASRHRGASPAAVALGEARAAELAAATAALVHRADASSVDVGVPPRDDFVLFCAPTPSQRLAYDAMACEATGGCGGALAAVALALRLCTSPEALLAQPPTAPPRPRAAAAAPADDENGRDATLQEEEMDDEEEQDDRASDGRTTTRALLAAVRARCPPSLARDATSGKLSVLAALLAPLSHSVNAAGASGGGGSACADRFVVVSGSVSSLAAVAALCASLRLRCSLLDGAVSQAARVAMVAAFNAAAPGSPPVFLLSRRAGGVGLSLVGAAKLVLFDSDWCAVAKHVAFIPPSFPSFISSSSPPASISAHIVSPLNDSGTRLPTRRLWGACTARGKRRRASPPTASSPPERWRRRSSSAAYPRGSCRPWSPRPAAAAAAAAAAAGAEAVAARWMRWARRTPASAGRGRSPRPSCARCLRRSGPEGAWGKGRAARRS